MRLRRPKRLVGYCGEFFVKDEKDQVAFILRIIEQSSKTDVGTLGDLAKRRRVISMLGEEFTRRGANALAFLQLVLFPQPKLRRQDAHGSNLP